MCAAHFARAQVFVRGTQYGVMGVLRAVGDHSVTVF